MRGLVCFLVLAASCWGRDAYRVDWQRLRPEILERFTELLKVDTSNPPGNETRAARVIRAALEREGIACRLYAAARGRDNLVARIRGDGSKRPVLMLAHTDVVGAQRERWSVDPFAAVRRNGMIYGRGAVDDKCHAAAGMMIMILLKRLDVRLARDVIFLAEAGEEGTSAVGIDFMAREHWPEIEAEFALAEGGSVVEQDGKPHHVLVATTEKAPRGVWLTARGSAGHASRPLADNAVVRLAAAVARLGEWQTPVRLNETTRAYFERMAAISPPDAAARYRGILDPARAAKSDAWFRQHEPGHYSMLRTSVVPTILKGGFRSNVIPSVAEAYVDVRALPDENMARFLEEMNKAIDDPSVRVAPARAEGRPAAPPSRTDTEMFRALQAAGRRMFDVPTLPCMLTGATDNAQLRARGVQAYGFGPMVQAGEGPAGGAHADDERISEQALYKLVEYLWNVVLEVAAR